MRKMRKCARILGKSTYKGSDVNELMESGPTGRIFKKYKAQEKAKADKKALLTGLSKGLSTQQKVKIFKELAERYSSSLLPRIGLLEAQKVGAVAYKRFCDEAGIKDISVPSYHRYETIEKTGGKEEYVEKKKAKKKAGQTYFTESEQATILSFCEGLKKTLQRQVNKGVISQKECDRQYNESYKKISADYDLAKKDLDVPQRFLDNPHNDEEKLLEYWWANSKEAPALEKLAEADSFDDN